MLRQDDVITAGHCVNTQQQCDNAAFVFKYYVTGFDDTNCNPTFPEITTDDVYFCESVSTNYDSRLPGTDIALIRLDRTVTGRTPATYHTSPVPTTIGQKLLTIGFPSGIPAKVDAGGTVTDDGSSFGYDFFKGTNDAFAGNSGSGVFDANGTMIGVLVRTHPNAVKSVGLLSFL